MNEALIEKMRMWFIEDGDNAVDAIVDSHSEYCISSDNCNCGDKSERLGILIEEIKALQSQAV